MAELTEEEKKKKKEGLGGNVSVEEQPVEQQETTLEQYPDIPQWARDAGQTVKDVGSEMVGGLNVLKKADEINTKAVDLIGAGANKAYETVFSPETREEMDKAISTSNVPWMPPMKQVLTGKRQGDDGTKSLLFSNENAPQEQEQPVGLGVMSNQATSQPETNQPAGTGAVKPNYDLAYGQGNKEGTQPEPYDYNEYMNDLGEKNSPPAEPAEGEQKPWDYETAHRKALAEGDTLGAIRAGQRERDFLETRNLIRNDEKTEGDMARERVAQKGNTIQSQGEQSYPQNSVQDPSQRWVPSRLIQGSSGNPVDSGYNSPPGLGGLLNSLNYKGGPTREGAPDVDPAVKQLRDNLYKGWQNQNQQRSNQEIKNMNNLSQIERDKIGEFGATQRTGMREAGEDRRLDIREKGDTARTRIRATRSDTKSNANQLSFLKDKANKSYKASIPDEYGMTADNMIAGYNNVEDTDNFAQGSGMPANQNADEEAADILANGMDSFANSDDVVSQKKMYDFFRNAFQGASPRRRDMILSKIPPRTMSIYEKFSQKTN